MEKSALGFSTFVQHVRLYERKELEEERGPYIGMMTVVWLTPNTIWICGLVGKINRMAYSDALNELMKLGAQRLLYERRGEIVNRPLIDSNEQGS